jgi:hypothetical protein
METLGLSKSTPKSKSRFKEFPVPDLSTANDLMTIKHWLKRGDLCKYTAFLHQSAAYGN